MFGYSERQEQLSIDNAFHVQVVIHLESLDRNCGRLTKKPVQLPVIVMALAQSALHRPDCRGLSSGHHVSRRWCPLRFIVLHAPNKSIPIKQIVRIVTIFFSSLCICRSLVRACYRIHFGK
jgi:hypothetical protein